jgi:hypothetical protein
MKIPLNLLNEILDTVKQQNAGVLRESRDTRYKFVVPPAPSEVKDTYYYQEVEVYFDYREGWVLDTRETNNN